MQKLQLIAVTAAAGLALSVFTGCTAVQKGAAAGGTVGAVSGAVVGHNSSMFSSGAGAVIAGGSGAAVGGLAGDAYAQITEEDIEREVENLRAELEAAEAEMLAMRDAGVSGEQLAEMESLRDQLDDALAELEGTRDQLAQAESKLSHYDQNLVQTRSSVSEKELELQNARQERDAALKRAERLAKDLETAQTQLDRTRNEMEVIQTSLREKEEAVNALREELSDLNVEMQQTSRGITLTIMDQLLFTPGSAQLTADGATLLGDVSAIIHDRFPGREIVVEGHTDNQPIVHSAWASNWELGAHRALSVLTELVRQHDFDPTKVSATTFGEHRPAAPNATAEGRAQNRRSVIVIVPEEIEVERNQFASTTY